MADSKHTPTEKLTIVDSGYQVNRRAYNKARLRGHSNSRTSVSGARYWQGRNAARSRVSVSNNPYAGYPTKAAVWLAGWDDEKAQTP